MPEKVKMEKTGLGCWWEIATDDETQPSGYEMLQVRGIRKTRALKPAMSSPVT